MHSFDIQVRITTRRKKINREWGEGACEPLEQLSKTGLYSIIGWIAPNYLFNKY